MAKFAGKPLARPTLPHVCENRHLRRQQAIARETHQIDAVRCQSPALQTSACKGCLDDDPVRSMAAALHGSSVLLGGAHRSSLQNPGVPEVKSGDRKSP
jgi:hypothetical protein